MLSIKWVTNYILSIKWITKYILSIKWVTNYISVSRTNDRSPDTSGSGHSVWRERQLHVLCESPKGASIYQNRVVKFFLYTFRLQRE